MAQVPDPGQVRTLDEFIAQLRLLRSWAAEPQLALDHHRRALTIAESTGNRHEQARAHTGLGDAHHRMGSNRLARDHWQQAFTRYTDLDLPEANQIKTKLFPGS